MNRAVTPQDVCIDIFEIQNPPAPLSLFGAARKSDFRAIWSTSEITLVAVGRLLEFVSRDDWKPDKLAKLDEAAILIGGASFASASSASTSAAPHLLRSSKKSAPGNDPGNDPGNGLSNSHAKVSGDLGDDVDDMWNGFESQSLILPKFLGYYTRHGLKLIQAGFSKKPLQNSPGKISEGFQELLADAHCYKIPQPAEKFKPAADTFENLSSENIANVVAKIKNTDLKKVVLANCQKFTGKISTEYLLQELILKFPECTAFAFDFGLKEVEGRKIFLGATPELLISINKGRLKASALASSTPQQIGIQSDKQADRDANKKLLLDQKELKEHLYVVRHILLQLKSAGAKLNAIPAPEILKLTGISHLHTPISGNVPGLHILEIIDLLAPTPAVAGVPTQAALELIYETENFNRGWYSGYVGWCTPGGEGEFFAALRSALLDESSNIHLFAGAGIVADSHPEKELAEIELKLRALRDLIL